MLRGIESVVFSISNFLKKHTLTWIEGVRKQQIFQVEPLTWSVISIIGIFAFLILTTILKNYKYGILLVLALLILVLMIICYYSITYLIVFPIKEKLLNKVIGYYISTIILFTNIYMLIKIFIPESFDKIVGINFNKQVTFYDIFYTYVDCFHFSVATTTTLGYGDICPTIPLTKLLSDLQVLLGVAILAISLGNYFSNGDTHGPVESSKTLISTRRRGRP